MITSEQLCVKMQSAMNSAFGSDEFVIFSDIGNFENYYRDENSNDVTMRTNGILSVGTPDLLKVKGYQAYTQAMQINFMIDCEQKGETTEEININPNNSNDKLPLLLSYPKVQEIKNFLNTFMVQQNGQSSIINDASGVSFEVTTNYSGLQVGEVQIQSMLGLCCEIIVFCELVVFETGVNSNNVEWLINNMPLTWQSYSVTKKREIESSPMNNETNNKSLAQSNGISINFTMPFLTNEISSVLEDDRYKKSGNTAYLLTRKRKTREDNYICILPSNSESGELGMNIGVVLNFVEGFADALDYSLFNIVKKNLSTFTISGLTQNKKYNLWLLVNNEMFTPLPIKLENETILYYDKKGKIVTSTSTNKFITISMYLTEMEITIENLTNPLVIGNIVEV